MQNLNGDPLPWLLDQQNPPSVRCWTLVDILDQPRMPLKFKVAGAAILEQPLAAIPS